ncbi:MAG: hypothetical protein BroJett011_49970 [Chloroflexota bacterium]|nr:MAG: hypothetical protein BroJett011_49970 [Chloroflexota bacterium]
MVRIRLIQASRITHHERTLMTYFYKITLGWLILFTFLIPWPAQADEPVQLILRNLPLQDDRLLVMTIQLENVTDLYGAEIQLRYDSTQLKVRDEDPRLEGVQIAPGPLLAFDDRFVALNEANAQAGLIDFVFTLLKPALPINQAGVLATVAFEVTGSGPFKVEVAQAKFVSSKLTAMPVATTVLALAGPQDSEPVSPQPLAARFPWSWIWAITGILGIVITALLLFRQAAAGTGVTGSLPAARRVPGVTASPTHTAVLLTEQGRRAMAQGHPAQAYDRFSQAIELDPANAAAWLGKGLVAQQEIEKRICFQRALALEPGNIQAQMELQRLDTSIKGVLK